MTDWKDISTAPRDGSVVYAKRVHGGRLICEGRAVWGVMAVDAPMRVADEYITGFEHDKNIDWADTPHWLKEDRRYSFPTPTHWMPLPDPPK